MLFLKVYLSSRTILMSQISLSYQLSTIFIAALKNKCFKMRIWIMICWRQNKYKDLITQLLPYRISQKHLSKLLPHIRKEVPAKEKIISLWIHLIVHSSPIKSFQILQICKISNQGQLGFRIKKVKLKLASLQMQSQLACKTQLFSNSRPHQITNKY